LATEFPEHGQAVGTGQTLCSCRPDALQELLPAILGLAIHETPVEILEADEDGPGLTPLAEYDRFAGPFQVIEHRAESIPQLQRVNCSHS